MGTKMLRKLFLSLLICIVPVCPMLTACDRENNPADSASVFAADQEADKTNPSSDTGNKRKTAEEVLQETEHLVGVTDQKNHRLVVYDLNKGDLNDPEALVWEYSDPRVYHAAGIKFRSNEAFGGDLVLFCGPKGAGIIHYATKEMLFFTSSVGNNPHTVELLPDGTFFVGSTNSQEVHCFDTLAGKTKATFILNWPCDVHGVLWDPEYDVLWIAGGNQVVGYKVSDTPANTKLTEIVTYKSIFPKGSIHDLAPVYGDSSKLWVTSADDIFQLDKETMEYSKSYRGASAIKSKGSTPGIGNYPDGIVVYVFPNACLSEWNMDRIQMFIPIDSVRHKTLEYKTEKDAYYKIRVFCTDYQ